MRLSMMAGVLALAGAGRAASGAVVINEIFYNAPDEGAVQWVELHNDGAAAVDVGGWVLRKVDGEAKQQLYKLPEGTSIGPGGFVVVANDLGQFRGAYGRVAAVGPMERGLARGGGRIELANGKGERVDLARYNDRAPWPVSADGSSASVERICPSSSGEAAENWAGSPMPPTAEKASGTPGQKNAAYSAVLPPVVKVGKTAEAVLAGETLKVEAEVKGAVKEVSLVWRAVVGGMPGAENVVKMEGGPGGKWSGVIPAQKSGTLVRWRVKAVGESGAVRLHPAEHDLRPTFSAYVHEKWPPAKVAFAQIINVRGGGGVGLRNLLGGGGGGRGAEPHTQAPRGSAALVWVDPKTGKTSVFDYVNVHARNNGGGFKVHLHKDRMLGDISNVNLIWEGSDRFVLAEMLAYDLYRRAGCAAPLAEFVRVWVDGRMAGYHLMVEQPNKAFLRRNKLRDDGNLYKILWYGSGVIGQHEKKTNVNTGHEDLLEIIARLDATQGQEQWKLIQEKFDVDNVAAYFAVNMVLSHWDGYFNNYITYHDINGRKKWMMFPWDQDKTWGYHDGIGGPGDVFTDMPLKYGGRNDKPPGGGEGGFFGGGNIVWWRRGGVFSQPLLANEQFRAVYLKKVKEILEKQYTKEVYFPVIDGIVEQLKEDVALRGRMMNANAVEWAQQRFMRDVEDLKTHLVKRREFLLEQEELRGVK